MNGAFSYLRRYSRDHNHRLSELAAALVAREIPVEHILDHVRAK